jgi:hypothetical protein
MAQNQNRGGQQGGGGQQKPGQQQQEPGRQGGQGAANRAAKNASAAILKNDQSKSHAEREGLGALPSPVFPDLGGLGTQGRTCRARPPVVASAHFAVRPLVAVVVRSHRNPMIPGIRAVGSPPPIVSIAGGRECRGGRAEKNGCRDSHESDLGKHRKSPCSRCSHRLGVCPH